MHLERVTWILYSNSFQSLGFLVLMEAWYRSSMVTWKQTLQPHKGETSTTSHKSKCRFTPVAAHSQQHCLPPSARLWREMCLETYQRHSPLCSGASGRTPAQSFQSFYDLCPQELLNKLGVRIPCTERIWGGVEC